MNESSLEQFENQLQSTAQAYSYPATPDIAAAVIRRLESQPAARLDLRRKWALAMIVFLILFVTISLAVPPVRAQILEFLQIGAVRIFIREPTPTPTAITPLSQSGTVLEGTATTLPTLQPFPSIDHLAGETTLENARNELDYPILLPTYPSDLGPPDRVFLQDLEAPSVLIVWMDPVEPDRIRLDLMILGPGAFAGKGKPSVMVETQVNDQPAVWMSGSHFLHLGGSMYQNVPLVVQGNILIWEQGAITYRLETDVLMEEAVRIAESLR